MRKIQVLALKRSQKIKNKTRRENFVCIQANLKRLFQYSRFKIIQTSAETLQTATAQQKVRTVFVFASARLWINQVTYLSFDFSHPKPGPTGLYGGQLAMKF